MAAAAFGVGAGAFLVAVVLPASVDSGEIFSRSPATVPAEERPPGAAVQATLPRRPALDAQAASPQPERAPTSGTDAPGHGRLPGDSGRVAVTERQSVKLGFLVLDVGPIARAGIGFTADAEHQERAWRAFVDELNASPDSVAWQIDPVFARYDLLDEDSQRAACLALTEDANVFAVFGGFNYAAPNRCVVHEHRTPMLSNMTSNPDSYYEESEGRLVTATARSSRMMANAVAVVGATGALDGGRVGIVAAEGTDPGGEATEHLRKALTARGHTVVHVARFHGPGGSPQTATEAQQMRRRGATAVFLIAGPLNATGFVQAADAQGYRPRYVTTDWAGMFLDASNANMPDSYDGALGVTASRAAEHRGGHPEPALGRRCREVYERRTGKKLAARGSDEYIVTLANCDLLRVFSLAMSEHQPGARGDVFTAAVARIGAIRWASWGDGSLRAGKTDASDAVLLQRWRSSCRCFQPVGSFSSPGA